MAERPYLGDQLGMCTARALALLFLERRVPVGRHVGAVGGELERKPRMTGRHQVVIQVTCRMRQPVRLALWGADVTAGTQPGLVAQVAQVGEAVLFLLR